MKFGSTSLIQLNLFCIFITSYANFIFLSYLTLLFSIGRVVSTESGCSMLFKWSSVVLNFLLLCLSIHFTAFFQITGIISCLCWLHLFGLYFKNQMSTLYSNCWILLYLLFSVITFVVLLAALDAIKLLFNVETDQFGVLVCCTLLQSISRYFDQAFWLN